MLQGKSDRLIAIGRCDETEINVGKTKSVRISREKCPLKIVINHKLGNVEYFKYLGGTITNDATCRREIRSRSAMEKQH